MRTFVLLTFLALISFGASAQRIDESKISPNKQMLHYQKFPASENIHWYELDDLLQARFSYNGLDKIVIYNNKMKVVQEWTEMHVTPIEVDLHLSTKYGSYKLKTVYEVEDHLHKIAFYSALAKVKGEGISMHAYDKALEFTDSISLLAMVE